jgi:hypothetical protein
MTPINCHPFVYEWYICCLQVIGNGVQGLLLNYVFILYHITQHTPRSLKEEGLGISEIAHVPVARIVSPTSLVMMLFTCLYNIYYLSTRCKFGYGLACCSSSSGGQDSFHFWKNLLLKSLCHYVCNCWLIETKFHT